MVLASDVSSGLVRAGNVATFRGCNSASQTELIESQRWSTVIREIDKSGHCGEFLGERSARCEITRYHR